jgi:hypothetical protein
MNVFAIIRDIFFNLNGCNVDDIPGSPTNVTMEVFPDQPGSLTVSWTAPEDTGFSGKGVIKRNNIRVYIDPQGDEYASSRDFEAGGSATSFVITGLPSGKSVTCRVSVSVTDPEGDGVIVKGSSWSNYPIPYQITIP